MDTSSNCILSRWFNTLPARCDHDCAANHDNRTQGGPGVDLFPLPQEQIGDQQIPQPRGRNDRRTTTTVSKPRAIRLNRPKPSKKPHSEKCIKAFVCQTILRLRCDSQAYGSEQTGDTTATIAAKNTGSLVIVKPHRRSGSNAGENSCAERVKNLPPAAIDSFPIRLPIDQRHS
jgi:hypothetical protein